MDSHKKMENLFVVGTDTGVGKTVLALLLMQFFFSRGYNPFYLKLVQTGCKDANDVDSDAKFIYRNVRQLKDKEPAGSIVYCFKNPKAPFFAACDEGKTIDLSVIEKAVIEKARSYSPLVIEGAGGVLVPVAEGVFVADLPALISARPVIAARAGLGTINHTLLTIEALVRRGLRPLGIVFINAGEKETPPEMIAENKLAVEAASGVKVEGVIGRIADFSKPPQDCYLPLTKMFGKL
ncbi:MAG TPA: dethiobiotin synthase [Syntrophales bacterium]|nr:dethiobiotin synthase [Syntrophales bacterium]